MLIYVEKVNDNFKNCLLSRRQRAFWALHEFLSSSLSLPVCSAMHGEGLLLDGKHPEARAGI